uniref:Uncharacterized protein n=1 Tax=Nicotiana tabacum TaxID=4097 RepID=A0A1S3Y631_TOBAC|nr:PREDICTED: uncharacterized protein LOC107772550 [Nicotiana tabacum]
MDDDMGHINTVYGMPCISDHSTMTLKLALQQRSGKAPFKFFNVWAEHEEFLNIVQQHGKQTLSYRKMNNIWLKLKALGPLLRKVNVQEFKYIKQKIERDRVDLINVQERICTQCIDDLLIEERSLMQNLEKWDLPEEGALKQKARAKWIKLGDSNSKYFTAVIKERQHKNQIVELTSLTGDKLTDPVGIKEEIVSFYKGLMGTTAHRLPTIDKKIMAKGPTLSQQQRILLCRDVSEQEIYQGLCSIGDDKASGVDGFNAYFFKKNMEYHQK